MFYTLVRASSVFSDAPKTVRKDAGLVSTVAVMQCNEERRSEQAKMSGRFKKKGTALDSNATETPMSVSVSLVGERDNSFEPHVMPQ